MSVAGDAEHAGDLAQGDLDTDPGQKAEADDAGEKKKHRGQQGDDAGQRHILAGALDCDAGQPGGEHGGGC